MDIRSRFSRGFSDFSPVGDGIEPVFEERIVDGVRKLVRTGSNNINDFIQKSLKDTLIYNILDKYNRGNVDVLNKAHGQFFDATVYPTSLAEAQNSIIKANRFFDSLPLDVRKSFSNSSESFVQSFFDGSLKEKLPEKYFKKDETKKSINKEDGDVDE